MNQETVADAGGRRPAGDGTRPPSNEQQPASRPQRPQEETRPYREYAAITATYLGLYGLFAMVAGRRGVTPRQMSPLDLVLLALATLRLSRLAAWEGVTSFMRLPLVEHDSPDDPITGPEQRPRGRGFLRAFGELILCTTCVGTWISALLTYGLYLAPSFTRPFLTIMATAALSQVSDAALALVYSSRDLQDVRKAQTDQSGTTSA
jgi:hypothetical protein